MKKEKKRKRTSVQSQPKSEWLHLYPICTWYCYPVLARICGHTASYQQVMLDDCYGDQRHPKLPGHTWQEREMIEFVTQPLPLVIPGWGELEFKWSRRLQTEWMWEEQERVETVWTKINWRVYICWSVYPTNSFNNIRFITCCNIAENFVTSSQEAGHDCFACVRLTIAKSTEIIIYGVFFLKKEGRGKKLKRGERKWESSCCICPRRTKIQKLLSFREKNQEGSFQQNKDSEKEVRLPPEQRGRISFMGLLSESNRKRLKRLHLLGFPKRLLRVDLTALQPSTQGDMFPLSDESITGSSDHKMKPTELRHTG